MTDGTGCARPAPQAGYRTVLADPLRRRAFVLSLALAMCGYRALESGLPAYANVVAKLPVRVVAIALAVDTLVIVIAQLLVLRPLRGWHRTSALATVGVVWWCSPSPSASARPSWRRRSHR